MPYQIQVVSLRSLKADSAMNLLSEPLRFRPHLPDSDRPSATPAVVPALGVEPVFSRTPNRAQVGYPVAPRLELDRTRVGSPVGFRFCLQLLLSRVSDLALSWKLNRLSVDTDIWALVVSEMYPRSLFSRFQNPVLSRFSDQTFSFAPDCPFNWLHSLVPNCACDRPLVGPIILFSVASLIWHPHSTALIEPEAKPQTQFTHDDLSKRNRSPLGMFGWVASGTSGKTTNPIQPTQTAQECSDTTARQGRGKLSSAWEWVERLTEFAAPLTRYGSLARTGAA